MTPAVDTTSLLVAVASGGACAALTRLAVRPTPRLGPRVRPYTVASRSALGRSADTVTVASPAASGGVGALLRPVITRAAERVGGLVDRAGDDALLLRLRQAGLLAALPPERRVQEYRVRQLLASVAWALVGGWLVALSGQPATTMPAAAALGFAYGLTRARARADRAIEQRRLRMRVELYTVNQLLSLHVRAGGGVAQAVRRTVERAGGLIAGEFAEALRLHSGGQRMSEALETVARASPEPHAARTYRLLAHGAEFGADLAAGLRALSADLRDERVEAMRRTATRRRAAMLVPIIAILAPVMLLFVAAPLPSIVFGGS
ncbi:hypothetical protein BH20ACT9_BH20ACT9_05810 [soil metagenome]